MGGENQIDSTLSTEEKIRVAAARVFVRKGYAATKTRDIAEEAGINIASLHYYYRSKDKLFELVIGESIRRFSQMLDQVFGSDLPLQDKIRQFVAFHLETFKDNPHVPNFVLSESQKNPELLDKMMVHEKSLLRLKQELKELAEAGVIREIHHAQFILNLMGLTMFPFLAKPIVQLKTHVDDEEYARILEDRKEMIPEIIINYLFLK